MICTETDDCGSPGERRPSARTLSRSSAETECAGARRGTGAIPIAPAPAPLRFGVNAARSNARLEFMETNTMNIDKMRMQRAELQRAAVQALKRGDVKHAIDMQGRVEITNAAIAQATRELLMSSLQKLNTLPPLPALPVVQREPFSSHERNGHSVELDQI